MRFVSEVPVEAMAARPWAKPAIIGPPPGMEHEVGSLMVQVDDKTALGRGFRFFAELEEGDLGALVKGFPIEFVVYANQLVPVSISILAVHRSALVDPGTGSAIEGYPGKAAWAMSIAEVQALIDENVALRGKSG